MNPGSSFSFRHLLIRCLLPSATSLGWGIFLAGLIIVSHVISLSIDKGAFLPEVFGPLSGQWVEIYVNNIVDPLERLLNNNTAATIAVGLFWGIVGLVIYASLMFVVSSISDVKRDSEEIQLSAEGLVAHHPMRQSLVARTIWRTVIGLLIPIVTVAFFPVIGDLLHRDVIITDSSSALEITKQIVLAVAGWVAVFHTYVVLIRLFVLRTRIFGEIIH